MSFFCILSHCFELLIMRKNAKEFKRMTFYDIILTNDFENERMRKNAKECERMTL